VPALTKKLAAARDEAATAVAALDQAAAEALRQVGAYTALVQQASGELRAKGLRHGDGGVDGGASDGSTHLGGEVWRPADGPGLVASVLSAAVAADSPRHPLAAAKWRHVGGLAGVAGRDALLAGLAGRKARA